MVNHGLNKMITMKIVYNLGVLGHLSPWVFLSLIVLGKFGSKKEKSLKFTKVLYYNKSSRIIFLFQNILILPIYRKCISIVYIYSRHISSMREFGHFGLNKVFFLMYILGRNVPKI